MRLPWVKWTGCPGPVRITGDGIRVADDGHGDAARMVVGPGDGTQNNGPLACPAVTGNGWRHLGSPFCESGDRERILAFRDRLTCEGAAGLGGSGEGERFRLGLSGRWSCAAEEKRPWRVAAARGEESGLGSAGNRSSMCGRKPAVICRKKGAPSSSSRGPSRLRSRGSGPGNRGSVSGCHVPPGLTNDSGTQGAVLDCGICQGIDSNRGGGGAAPCLESRLPAS